MNRPNWKFLVFGIVLVAALFVVAGEAKAWCGSCGTAVYGPFPTYTAWNSCCGSDWYATWRPGPVRRLLFGPYRWYGYYGYGYGCCYPTYNWTASCCGTVSTCCGDTNYGVPGAIPGMMTVPGGPTPANPTPAAKPAEGPNAPTPAAPAPGTETQVTPDNTGILTVTVPYDAKVTINGLPTKSVGSRRQFVSYDLKEGFSYKYEVMAEVVRDGRIIEDTKTVVLTAGSTNVVAFGFNLAPSDNIAAAQ
jgi:uncharacterized protein (TIGR03000 family)